MYDPVSRVHAPQMVWGVTRVVDRQSWPMRHGPCKNSKNKKQEKE